MRRKRKKKKKKKAKTPKPSSKQTSKDGTSEGNIVIDIGLDAIGDNISKDPVPVATNPVEEHDSDVESQLSTDTEPEEYFSEEEQEKSSSEDEGESSGSLSSDDSGFFTSYFEENSETTEEEGKTSCSGFTSTEGKRAF